MPSCHHTGTTAPSSRRERGSRGAHVSCGHKLWRTPSSAASHPGSRNSGCFESAGA